MQKPEIVIESFEDGFVAYVRGVDGIVIGEGNTFGEALADVLSALQFHMETFGADTTNNDLS